ncbi:MAG: sugar phosphate isomerase/epimerase [Clostridia bacterium]|nr:sugar phosphate isomerase/epimerase [Clostridia bacterium]
MDIKFKLGVITDEVTQDIFEAAEFCHRHGLKCMEVRSVNGRSPFDYTDDDVEQIIAAAKKYDLDISAISSPVFKCEYDDEEAIKANVAGFEKCAIMANKMGAKYIRGFDFWNKDVPVEVRATMYGDIIALCEKYDVYCALESDPAIHSSTPHKLADLLLAINNPRIKALFDPGNEIWVTGKTSEDAYDKLAPCGIVNMHVKDGINTNGNTVAVMPGTGVADFVGIFKKLIANGYDGAVMLETHYRKNVELDEEQLKRPGGNAFSDGAYEASEESIVALKEIINKALKEITK